MRKTLARNGVVTSKDTMYAAITKLLLNCKNHCDTKSPGMIMTENWPILSFYIRDKKKNKMEKRFLH